MKRALTLFSIVFAQAALTLAVGYFLLAAATPMSVKASAVTYGSLRYTSPGDFERAQSEIAFAMDEKINAQQAEIRYAQDAFIFGFDEIGLSLDQSTLRDKFDSGFEKHRESSLLGAYLTKYESELEPAYTLDSASLRAKLELIDSHISYDPVNASIAIDGDEITLTESSEGLEYDVDASLPKTRSAFEASPFVPYTLAGPDTPPAERVVHRLQPDVPLSALERIDGVIAEASTPIAGNANAAEFREAAARVNMVLVFAEENREGLQLPAGVFSLREYINMPSERLADEQAAGAARNPSAEDSSDSGPPSVNAAQAAIPDGVAGQVASTLYMAALHAGIDAGKIYRAQPGGDLVYAERGLGARYESDGPDFQFENTLPYNILIIAEADADSFTVRIAGNASHESTPVLRRTLTTETEALDGVDVVSVYRNGELVATDEYAAKPR